MARPAPAAAPVAHTDPTEPTQPEPTIAAEPPPAPASATPTTDPGPYQRFAVTWRGYHRRQVDEHITHLTRQVAALAARHADAEHARELAEQQLRDAPTQLLPIGKPADQRTRGVAVNIARLLQAAEREATDIRAQAARQAEELLEQARAEATSIVATAEYADQVRAELHAALRTHQDGAERGLELLDQIHDQFHGHLRRVQRLANPTVPAQTHNSPENA